MGEIADALRRARAERAAREQSTEREPLRPAREADAEDKRDVPPVASPPPRERRPAPAAEREPRIAPAPRPAPTPRPLDPNREILKIRPTRSGFWQARAMESAPPGAVTERFRHLALRVRRELEARGVNRLAVTSGLRHEGKTVTSCNLAMALASMSAGRRVILMDLDLRRPSVARGLGIRPKVGFDAVLRGEADLDEACHRTSMPDLDVLPVVRPIPHAHEMLSTDAFGRAMAELGERYALVIADTPPVLLVPDVSLAMPHFGAALFVVRSGQTSRSNMEEALGLLPRDQLIGIHLNEAGSSRHGSQYGYYMRRDEEPLSGEEDFENDEEPSR